MSSEAAYNARLQEIRSRQENWMKQRQSAIEREKVEHEIISSRADSYDAPLSSGHASTSSQGSTVGSKMDSTIQKVAPEELVDALTIRLAEKIKAELQLEDRAELGKVQARVQREKANVNKLEGYLAKEIASCKCPICLELMVPPEKNPMLLFPCGHTFCSICLKTHEKYNRRKCPYCRQKIDHTAANISLQQLIQNYVQQKRRLVQKQKLGARPGSSAGLGAGDEEEEERKLFEATLGDDVAFDSAAFSEDELEGDNKSEEEEEDATEKYLSQYRSVDMRVKILENELLDTKEEQLVFDNELDAANKVLEHLLMEKQKCLREEEMILKMKKMIQEQLQVQESKLKEVTRKKEECTARSSLIVETLKPLNNELDKLKLLMEGCQF